MTKKLQPFLNRKMFIILLMGFSSGLPLALTAGTLQAWLASEELSLSTIGIFGLVGLPYSFKFIWAPLMDRFTLNSLGRRRSWMMMSQVLLILSVALMGFCQPQNGLLFLAILAVAVSFFSASQDIVLDAWRRESLSDDELGFGSSVHVNGYLFSFRMISGAFALILSDFIPWSQVYLIMALFLVTGLIATWLAVEPQLAVRQPRTFKESVFEPFIDYFSKPGAWLILIFILLYKLGDNMAGHMSIPFYKQMGYTNSEIGAISKVIGWISLASGGLIGGALIYRLKLIPSLLLFGIFQGAATMGFALLSLVSKDLTALSLVIAVDNFAIGMGTTAFVAFMASLTNKKFTATQYALLTSFMGIPRTIIPSFTGYLAEMMGWFPFFTLCTLAAIPGLLMIYWLRKLAFSGHS